ncbi:MAG: hypothetical protein JSU08_14695 [Acidobacteria bacterium]|nr:hypothetical protein [Acidobacteriota bacterium]
MTEPFVVLALVHLTVLAWRLPLFDRLPGWVFATHAKPLHAAALMLLIAIPLLCLSAARLARRRAVAIALLVIGGYAFQHALAWSEGRGLDGMRERIVRSGHAEFADVAVAQPSLWSVVTHYERKVQGGELGRYAHSKPPGTLLAYMATERLARRFAEDGSPAARRAALNTTAAVLWPFICYLALIPLYAVVRTITTDATALLACASYGMVPSVSLITLHTDQFLFPLLGAISVWIAVVAGRRRSVVTAGAAGLWLWMAAFFTLPMLLLAPVMVAAMWAVTYERGAQRMGVAATETARLTAAMAAGLVIGLVGFRIGIGYDLFARYADARQFNAVWKGWDGGAFQTLYFGWMNLLEFLLWVGLPVGVLALARIRRAVVATAGVRLERLTIPALAIAAVLAYVAFRGESKGETARLWLFIVPWLCALAADELRQRWPEGRPMAAGALLVLQWATVVLTKTGQDFF